MHTKGLEEIDETAYLTSSAITREKKDLTKETNQFIRKKNCGLCSKKGVESDLVWEAVHKL